MEGTVENESEKWNEDDGRESESESENENGSCGWRWKEGGRGCCGVEGFGRCYESDREVVVVGAHDVRVVFGNERNDHLKGYENENDDGVGYGSEYEIESGNDAIGVVM